MDWENAYVTSKTYKTRKLPDVVMQIVKDTMMQFSSFARVS